MKVAMPFDLDHALRYLIAAEGSDLHLKVPAYPLVRLHGKLEPIVGDERLTPQDTERVLQEMLNDPNKLAEFEAENEVDFSYALEGLARFRVNAFRQKGFVSLVLRAIPVNIKSIEELSLPPVIRRLAEEERGIILLTGTTGSGKSTTLAAMIDHMNRTMHKHIVTIEDPIEFLHPDRNSIVNQREVGQDTASFKRALRRVAAPGPGRHPRRRDARRGDGPDRADRGGDRPPRALDAAHRGRVRVDQPHHRLLRAAPAVAGAGDDRRHAEGDRLPAPRADRGRQRPRGHGRDPGHDRPRARHDPRPEARPASSPR